MRLPQLTPAGRWPVGTSQQLVRRSPLSVYYDIW